MDEEENWCQLMGDGGSIRASLTQEGRAATREFRPDFSVGACSVTARDGPEDAVASLAAPESRPGLALYVPVPHPLRPVPALIAFGPGRKFP